MVDEVEHFLPGVGSRHRHVLENGQELLMYTSSFSYNPEEKILFSETDEKRKNSTYYTIEKAGKGRSRLTMDFYIQKNPVRQVVFKLTEKSAMETRLRQSLENLDPVVREMVLPLEF
jgi:hypothetical protein